VHSASSYTYGTAASSIVPIAPVNIMHPSIIKLFAHTFFQFAAHTGIASMIKQHLLTTRF
jgi:hypothetical protein